MKLFIASLDYSVSSDNLQTVFEEYGTVNYSKVVEDRDTGRSKGFGFIEMENDNEAQLAMRELNGMELRGREIVVKVAEDRR